MAVSFRQERPTDYAQIEKLVEIAFKDMIFSNQTEHLIVKRIRKSEAFVPELSILAQEGEKIIGHILLSKVHIENSNESFECLSLAPVSVLPSFQNKNIGSRLILHAHDVARSKGFKAVVLIGHGAYYPRFGYRRASEFEIYFPFESSDENCLAIELHEASLDGISGTVKYPKAFLG